MGMCHLKIIIAAKVCNHRFKNVNKYSKVVYDNILNILVYVVQLKVKYHNL
jgi:hypothetical protein